MFKKPSGLLLCLISLFYLINPLIAQKQFSVFQYTSKNGLPQNSVKSLIKDDNDFLWMTTEGGLVRFDGRNFKVFNKTNTPFIKADRLTDINKAPSGEYLAYDNIGNTYQILSNKITTVNPNHYKLFKFYISDKSQKNTYAASPENSGLIIYKNSLPIDTIKTSNFDVLDFFVLDNELYFLNRKCGLFKIDVLNKKIQPCKLNNYFSFKAPVLFNKYGHPGVFIKDGFRLFEIKPGIKKNELNAELICNELPLNCVVLDIYFDKINKILYVGTDSKGLFLYKEKFFRTLLINDQPEEGTNNVYYSQVESDSNTSLSYNKRQFSLNGVSKSSLPFSFNRQGVIRDKNNNIWYNNKNVLYKYNLSDKKNISIKGSFDQYAYCFFEQGDTMWIATTHTISYVYNDTLHLAFNWQPTLISNFPFDMLIAPDDKLWFSNGQGVYRLEKKTFKVDTIAPLNKQIVRNLTLYNNYIFIGTYGNGYYIYKDGRLVQMPLDKNNYLSQTHTFVFDSAGYVWMTTNRGLFKAKTKDLLNFFSDSTIKVNYVYYGEEDGIINSEFNGGCSPAHLVLKNGYVSLPTMDGMVWFKPSEVFDARADIPILIDAIYFDDKIVDNLALKKINPSVQSLRFDFATPYWGNDYNLHLKYKLEGFNKQWVDLDNQQSSIVFSNLRSGNYTLLIRKKAGLNADDFVTTTVAITIEKKYFETIWFLLLCILTATVFVIIVARVYANNIKKRNKQLEEKVLERTFELGKANKQMQRSVAIKDKLISILSHDILTPLRFISMVAKKGGDTQNEIEKESMRIAFNDIKNTTDKLRDNTQNILDWIKHQNKRINVNNTHISVRDLTDEVASMFKEMADSKHIVLINTVSHDDVIKTDRNILSIILHNIIGNAVKFTEHGSIAIQSESSAENYLITITDTGEGMNAERLNHIQNLIEHKTFTTPNPSSGENGNGLGYVIISELIELLNGNIAVRSEEDKGTAVTINLRIS